MHDLLTTTQAAEFLAVPVWQIRRLYEDGELNEPPRFAGNRVIPRDDLPMIREALVERGWLSVPIPNRETAAR